MIFITATYRRRTLNYSYCNKKKTHCNLKDRRFSKNEDELVQLECELAFLNTKFYFFFLQLIQLYDSDFATYQKILQTVESFFSLPGYTSLVTLIFSQFVLHCILIRISLQYYCINFIYLFCFINYHPLWKLHIIVCKTSKFFF